MSGRAKYYLFSILIGSITLSANIPSFDTFHSNIGEIIILSPIKREASSSPKTTPPTEIGTRLTRHENLADTSAIQSVIVQDENQSNKELNMSFLSEKEIDDFLFDQLFEWDEEISEITLEKVNWYKFYTIEMGWGYSDNPLNAAYNPQKSQFAELNLETFFLNQQNPQHEILLYLFAEGKNFYELESEEVAGLILSQFDYSFKPLQNYWGYGIRFQHTFFDQGMDFSEIGNPYRTKITSHRYELSPNLKWHGENGGEGKFEFSWSKERLRQFEDQNTKFGVSASYANKSTKPLKWQTKLFHIQSKYKDREPKDGTGNTLPGRLETKQTGIFTKFLSSAEDGWSKDLFWSTGVDRVNDNHAGFYDYTRFKTSLGKTIETENWESQLSLGYNKTRYSERLVDNLQRFSKDHWSFELGLTREWNEYWKTYAKWMHETDQSNNADFSFESNFWSFGISWEK